MIPSMGECIVQILLFERSSFTGSYRTNVDTIVACHILSKSYRSGAMFLGIPLFARLSFDVLIRMLRFVRQVFV